jgi:hypothetical protein
MGLRRTSMKRMTRSKVGAIIFILWAVAAVIPSIWLLGQKGGHPPAWFIVPFIAFGWFIGCGLIILGFIIANHVKYR